MNWTGLVDALLASWPLAGLLAAFVYALVKAWPILRKVSQFVDDMNGEPERPGFPARPGLLERLATVEHEVKTNHGTSLKDAVRRIEADLAAHVERADTMLSELHERYAPEREEAHHE